GQCLPRANSGHSPCCGFAGNKKARNAGGVAGYESVWARFVKLDQGPIFLLTRTVLHHLLDFPFHRLEIERRRILHRRIVNCGLRELSDVLLDHDEAPELAGEEVIAVTEGAGVGRLAASVWRALEWILADVDQPWHVGGGLFARPAIRLLVERELEVI